MKVVFNLSLKLKCWQLQSPAETHENTNNIRSAHAHILPQSFQGKTDIEAEKFSTKHFQFEFEGSRGEKEKSRKVRWAVEGSIV